MEFGSIDDILKFAIDREIEAVDFYKDLADQATRNSLKETFVRFAAEEQKHADMLSDIAGHKDKIDSYEFAEITDLKISDYMVEMEYEQGMPMPDILRIAMKREEKAVKLYGDLAAKAGNDDAKKVFDMLAQEEKKHKLALETMYDDYLADQDN